MKARIKRRAKRKKPFDPENVVVFSRIPDKYVALALCLHDFYTRDKNDFKLHCGSRKNSENCQQYIYTKSCRHIRAKELLKEYGLL